MSVLKLYFTLSIALASLLSLRAAETVYNFSTSESFVFSYSSRGGNKAETNNFFIRELSKINVNSLTHTRYTYNFSIEKSILKVKDNTFKVTASISGGSCTGDIYYKGFDISDILQPEFSDFTAVVVYNGNYIKKVNFKDIWLDENNAADVSFDFETWDDTRKYELLLTDIEFYSGPSDREAFLSRLENIDNYYASIEAMERESNQLKRFRVSKSNVYESLIILNEAKRLTSNILDSDFLNELSITGEKKIAFDTQLKILNSEVLKLKNTYDSLIQNSDFLSLSNSSKALANEFVDETSLFNSLSQDVTHAHQSYFYYLGTLQRTTAELNAFRKGIEQILSKTKYCNDTHLILNQMKKEVYQAYLQKSYQLSSAQEYHRSRGVLLQALNFYNLSIGTGIPLELNIAISKANYGIYNSYLHLIDRAIDIGNYELAENYIDKASNFQELNSSTIISGQYMDNVYNELVKLYINKGISLNQEESFEEANYCFEQAQIGCIRLGIFNHDYLIKHGLDEARNGLYNKYLVQAGQNIDNGQESLARENLEKAHNLAVVYPSQIRHLPQIDSLTNRFEYQLYLNRIADGKKYLTAGNYNEAYSNFLSALILEQQSAVTIYDPLVDLFAEAAIPYLLDQCKMGDLMVNQNRLQEARQIYDSVFQLQSDFGLYYEQDLQSGLAFLNNSIFVRQCEVANENFEEILARFDNAVEAGDFISAMDILDESDEIVRKNYYCDIDQSKIALLQTEYGPASTYQKLADEAQKALSENNYKRFTEIYSELEDLSERYEVIRTRIEPMPLHYLFSIKKNLAILESSLNQYRNEDDLALAMRILQVMESSNISGKDAKGLQQTLGQKLAYIDRTGTDSDNPKVNVQKYTNGSSWYKHFKKAYIKNW